MPRYFLDFDYTLFDTDAFIGYLFENFPEAAALSGISREDLSPALNLLVEEGKLMFADGALKHFLYPDAEAFLAAHAQESCIVTHGNAAMQRAKVESIFSEHPPLPVFYTAGERKGPFLARLLKDAPSAERVFIDDFFIELDSVAEHLPAVTLYEMRRRPGDTGSGKYPLLKDFKDLPD